MGARCSCSCCPCRAAPSPAVDAHPVVPVVIESGRWKETSAAVASALQTAGAPSPPDAVQALARDGTVVVGSPQLGGQLVLRRSAAPRTGAVVSAGLASAEVSLPYCGLFGNGWAEWLPASCRPATDADLRSSSVQLAVAKALAALHQWKPPAEVSSASAFARPVLWDSVQRYLQLARAAIAGGSVESGAMLEAPAWQNMSWIDVDAAETELRALERARPFREEVCVCHNNVCAEALYIGSTGSVRMAIGSEVGLNPGAFDIACFFCEVAGSAEPDYGHFPSEQQQLEFCEAYCRAAGSGSPAALAADVGDFVLIAHWLAALKSVAAADRTEGIRYAERRAAEFYRQKAIRRKARRGSARR